MFDEGTIPDGLSQSEADASLCAMIAFRTGPDPEMVDAVFRESALYRDKWERSDYRAATIRAGIRACNGVFHHSLKKRPPFVLNDGKKDYVNATLLADYVRSNLSYKFVREAERNSYQKYVYRDGVYQIYSDDMFKGEIKTFVTDYDPMLLKMSVIDEAYKQLVTDLDYVLQTELNVDETLINFQNGLLDIRSLATCPHSPDVLSSIKIPCDWTGGESPTPVFDSYLDTLTSGDQETQTLLLEFMGACLSNVPGSRMKKSLFMYGPGDTGKSQLKRLTERLLGAGNYTGIDLQQMESRFGTSAIYGKRLAGTSDMSYMTVSELKTFKLATGGDSMFIEFKGKDSFQFEYRGMLWFCMNNLPKFGGDDGQWVFERILPIHCPNVLPPEKQDHELLDKMYSERAGISMSPLDSQLLETRQFQLTEIARIFRIPPHMLGDLSKATFSNIEHESLEFVKYTLTPWICRWESSLTDALLTREEQKKYEIRFNVDGLLRGDYKSRMEGYAVGINNGFLCPNDVRRLEGFDLIPEEKGGNSFLVQGAMIRLEDAGIYAGKKDSK